MDANPFMGTLSLALTFLTVPGVILLLLGSAWLLRRSHRGLALGAALLGVYLIPMDFISVWNFFFPSLTIPLTLPAILCHRRLLLLVDLLTMFLLLCCGWPLWRTSAAPGQRQRLRQTVAVLDILLGLTLFLLYLIPLFQLLPLLL